MQDECNFSETILRIPGINDTGTAAKQRMARPESIVIECPECGAIRTISVPLSGPMLYIRHKTLLTSTRIKPRWKRINGVWQWVEGE